LPRFTSASSARKFRERIKKIIGPIAELQAETEEILKPLSKLSRKKKLPSHLQAFQLDYDMMRKSRIVTQRWADGIVCFSALNGPDAYCPVWDIYNMITLAGVQCFLGLSKKLPIRGGIDAAWATELHPREIYGAAAVKAYELESSVAQWPRIVVGERLVAYLDAWTLNRGKRMLVKQQKYWALKCRAFISIDSDGLFFVDYLSDAFTNVIPRWKIIPLYVQALAYIENQIVDYQKTGNLKLLSRYCQLRAYYENRRLEMKRITPADLPGR
jgi:hypothetical protein